VYRFDDTIVAIASAAGGAARGIVRLSGPDVVDCLEPWFTPDGAIDLAAVRLPQAISGLLRLEGFSSPAPCDLYLWPTKASYTRQPTAEMHLPGSPPLLAATVRRACEHGARLAQPGEFTLRAFLAGRLDLTQAEAVLGVIDAADRRELDAALAQLAGGLGGSLRALRDRLLELLAHLEAGLDFVDEDIEFIAAEETQRQLQEAQAVVAELIERTQTRSDVSERPRIALFGWPNVGKSSLFNALAGREEALVSPRPGATRDYLSARIDLEGLPCELIDTAGIEPDAALGIALEAQASSSQQRSQARLLLLCLDRTRPLNAWEQARLLDQRNEPPTVIVLTKADQPRVLADLPAAVVAEAIEASSLTGAGLQALRRRIRELLLEASESASGVVLNTAVRCHGSLLAAAESLQRAAELAHSAAGDELVAAELRIALDQLGQVVGAVYNDDLLDRIFSRFCIGK
jgi:tRNA modification GTPase